MGAGTELTDGPHQQIANGRVAAKEVFQLVQDVIPVQLLRIVVVLLCVFVGGLFVVLLAVQLVEQDVGEIARIVHIHGRPVLVDDRLDDELADVRAPRLQLLHVAAIDGHEPRQEIDSIALVDVPEDLVEKADHFAEFLVVVVESRAAHVVRENVGAHRHHRRLQIDSSAAGGGRFQRQFVHHQAALGRQDSAQRVELHRVRTRVAPMTGNGTAIPLQVGPIAQRQSYKKMKQIARIER